MSHFYGYVKIDGKAPATKAGTKNSGLETKAASWQGAVEVTLTHNSATGKDEYAVALVTHHGAGVSRDLITGNVDGSRKGSKQ